MVGRINRAIATAAYQPGQAPQDPIQLQVFLVEELRKIASCITLLQSGHLDIMYAPPPKPRDGDIRYADGTRWNPGGGRGIYYFDGTSWNQLG